MHKLKKIFEATDRVYTLFGVLAAILLVIMALVVITSIISRMVGFYISGLVHAAGYLMAASNTLALAYTFREKQHIRITLIISKLSNKARFRTDKVALLFALIVCAYVAYYMGNMSYYSWLYNELATGSTLLRLWIPQAIAAIGCSILCLAIAQEFVESALGLNKEVIPRSTKEV